MSRNVDCNRFPCGVTVASCVLLAVGCANHDVGPGSGRATYPSAWGLDVVLRQQNCSHISGTYLNDGELSQLVGSELSQLVESYGPPTIAGAFLRRSTKFGIPELVRFSYDTNDKTLRAEFLVSTDNNFRVTDSFILHHVDCNRGLLEYRDEIAGGSAPFVRVIRDLSIGSTGHYLAVFFERSMTASTLFIIRTKSTDSGWFRFAKVDE